MPKSRNYQEVIKGFFKRKQAAFLGVEIINELIDKCGITKTNATKVLNRLSFDQSDDKILFSSRPVKIQGNQYAYCYGKADKIAFWSLMRTAKPILYAALERFKANNYIISKQELCKVSGCLLVGDEKSKYNTFSKLLRDMGLFFNLFEIIIEDESFIIERGKTYDENSSEYIELKEQRAISCALMPSIIAYCKGINLLQANDTPHYVNRNKPFACFPEANNLFFDITGFSKTSGLVEYVEGSHGKGKKLAKSMVVFDVKIDEGEYTEIDYIGFAERVRMLVFATNNKALTRKIIPVIVCNGVNQCVKKRIQDEGFFALSLNSIYGKITSRMISFVRKTEKQTTDFVEILESIDHAGIQSLDAIKGDIFEMLVERVLRQYFAVLNVAVSFKSRELIKNSKSKAEIDILISESGGNQLNIAVECKGFAGAVKWRNPKDSFENGFDNSNNYARHFFGETISKLKEKFGRGNFCLCMVAANGFDDETRMQTQTLGSYKYQKLELLYSAKELLGAIKQTCKEQKIPFKSDDASLIEKFFIAREEA